MKAYVITLENNKDSVDAADRCIESHHKFKNNFEIEKYEATDSKLAEVSLKANYIQWNYPWSGVVTDFKSGLVKHAYTTADPKKRMACFVSHYRLWYKCKDLNEPILVLEHDAIFIRNLDLEQVLWDSPFDILGINNPLMATRKAKLYHDTIISTDQEYQKVPDIDDITIPQGLAGNSAYIITPNGANTMLELVKEYGAWPNDALMCKQLVKSLGVTKTFYTKIQGIRSTTTL